MASRSLRLSSTTITRILPSFFLQRSNLKMLPRWAAGHLVTAFKPVGVSAKEDSDNGWSLSGMEPIFYHIILH